MAEHYSMFDNDPDMRELLRKINEDERGRKRVYRQFKWGIITCIIGIIALLVWVIVTNMGYGK